MALSRYITHAVVLIVVLALSGVATIDRSLPAALNLRLGAVNAEGLALGEGGSSGSVALGRAGTIVKPAGVPTAAISPHAPLIYQVQPGQSLADLARQFHITTESIRWSNYATLKSLGTDVSAGQTLLLPPVDGVVVTANAGDSAQSLAAALHVDASAVLDFNYIRATAATALVPGSLLVVPGGRGADFEQVVAAPPPPDTTTRSTASPVSPRSSSSTASSGSSARPAVVTWAPSSGNRFAFGYCTWYVANRVHVPWLGNASAWFGQAQAYGWRTGQTPAAGAIMVTMESGWGHVAYVESVGPGGSWTVSEMNYKAWDVVSSRTISPGQVPLLGFIYGP